MSQQRHRGSFSRSALRCCDRWERAHFADGSPVKAKPKPSNGRPADPRSPPRKSVQLSESRPASKTPNGAAGVGTDARRQNARRGSFRAGIGVGFGSCLGSPQHGYWRDISQVHSSRAGGTTVAAGDGSPGEGGGGRGLRAGATGGELTQAPAEVQIKLSEAEFEKLQSMRKAIDTLSLLPEGGVATPGGTFARAVAGARGPELGASIASATADDTYASHARKSGWAETLPGSVRRGTFWGYSSPRQSEETKAAAAAAAEAADVERARHAGGAEAVARRQQAFLANNKTVRLELVRFKEKIHGFISDSNSDINKKTRQGF